jgi:hypothetical protein
MDVPHITQENMKCKAHFEVLPRALRFLRLYMFKDRSVRHRTSGLQARTCVQKTHNTELFSSFSNSICRHKGMYWALLQLLLRNIIQYSFPVSSACNILNQT